MLPSSDETAEYNQQRLWKKVNIENTEEIGNFFVKIQFFTVNRC